MYLLRLELRYRLDRLYTLLLRLCLLVRIFHRPNLNFHLLLHTRFRSGLNTRIVLRVNGLGGLLLVGRIRGTTSTIRVVWGTMVTGRGFLHRTYFLRYTNRTTTMDARGSTHARLGTTGMAHRRNYHFHRSILARRLRREGANDATQLTVIAKTLYRIVRSVNETIIHYVPRLFFCNLGRLLNLYFTIGLFRQASGT